MSIRGYDSRIARKQKEHNTLAEILEKFVKANEKSHDYLVGFDGAANQTCKEQSDGIAYCYGTAVNRVYAHLPLLCNTMN